MAPGKRPSHEWLRWAAKIYYTTNSDRISIVGVKQHPMFQSLDIKTLEAWSRRDRWVDLREDNAEMWRKQVNRAIGSKIVESRRNTLNKLETLVETMFKKLEMDPATGDIQVPANSYEGMVNAFTKLVTVMHEYQSSVHDSILPDIEPTHDEEEESAGPPPQLMAATKLDPDRAQEMAVQLLHIQNQTNTQLFPDAMPAEEE